MKLHPGIRIDRIPVKGGPGVIFAIGVLVILLVGVPETRLFLVGAFGLGILMAGILRLIRR
jgi:hypothetical protein